MQQHKKRTIPEGTSIVPSVFYTKRRFLKMTTVPEQLEALLIKKFETEEFQHLFLVEIKQSGDKIQVFIDSDNAVLFEHCVQISRYLESAIEENNWLGEKYTLDVSSAGVGAPLVLHRQYKKNIGRTLSVDVKDDHKNVKGILTEVHDDSIVISYEEKVRVEGKKKKELIQVNKQIALDNINKAVVKITF